MKKIATYMMLALSLIMVSCGTKAESEKVVERIESGETLDHADYTVMISYLGEFAEKAQPVQDKIDNAVGDNSELDSELAVIKKDYPYTDLFEKTLETATPADVGEQNMALLDKFAPLQWFTAPTWLTVDPDAAVAGMVVDTPPEGDSDGVIAGGAVDVEKK